MNCERFSYWLFLVYILHFTSIEQGHGKTLFLSAEGDNTTGENWSEAFNTPEQAIEAAVYGDEIWVKSGYYGGFEFKPGVRMYGGFDGTESLEEFSERDWTKNITSFSPFVRGLRMADETTIDGIVVRGGHGRDGGGVICSGTNEIANCRITDNYAYDDGGGVYIPGNSKVLMTNCLIDHNESGHMEYPWNPLPNPNPRFIGAGGGLFFFGGDLTMINCTVSDNTSYQGDGLYAGSGFGSFVIINCIIADRGVGWFRMVHSIYPVDIGMGSGNLGGDPMFVDPDNGNYRLQRGSPCIDSGTNTGLAIDLDGIPRPVGDYDMGAFEFPTFRGDINGDGNVNEMDLMIFQRDWGKVSGL